MSLVSFVEKDGENRSSAVLMGRTLNVSAGGILLEVIEPMGVGTDLDMEIALGDRVIPAMGTVVYCRQARGDLYLVGIKFKEVQGDIPGAAE